jgi:hypothetical protein
MNKIQLTNEQVLKSNEVLKELNTLEFDEQMYEDSKTSRSKWQKFAYAISINEGHFEKYAKAIKKAIEPPKKFMEYENKRTEIVQEMADKDSEGKPIISGRTYVITKQKSEFDKKISDLREEYKEAIDEQKKIEEGLNELMERVEEVEVYSMKQEWLPLTLKGYQIGGLRGIVEEDGTNK